MRIGIDLGGTKIEVIALSDEGRELFRKRVDTPRNDYERTLKAIEGLVLDAEKATGQRGSVGLGIPGTLSPFTGKVKNSNSVWLNGQQLDEDLALLLNREVHIANDANCLAVSEATDGAGAGRNTVFAVIIGTGCGSGVPRTRGGTAMPGNGGTIRCRGRMMRKDSLPAKCRVIAENQAALRRSFRVLDLRRIISVCPASG